VVNGQTFTLAYNAENQLVSVTGPSMSAAFVYDGDGRQVKSIINGVTTLFVGAHYEVQGATITKYYFAGSQRIAMRANGTLTYLLGDHLGSTSIVTNASGAKISEQRYKPWGETRFTSGTLPTKYQYTGQRSEMDSLGLYFYAARWYDPALGRFTSADSIIPGAGTSQAWDRYAYAMNNPLRYIDPTGHRPCGDGEDIDCEGRKNATDEKYLQTLAKDILHFLDASPEQAREFAVKMDKSALVLDLALEVGVLTSTVVGAVVGSLAGGVGAIPGAAGAWWEAQQLVQPVLNVGNLIATTATASSVVADLADQGEISPNTRTSINLTAIGWVLVTTELSIIGQTSAVMNDYGKLPFSLTFPIP
jgi:RHS repeat-associated protein